MGGEALRLQHSRPGFPLAKDAPRGMGKGRSGVQRTKPCGDPVTTEATGHRTKNETLCPVACAVSGGSLWPGWCLPYAGARVSLQRCPGWSSTTSCHPGALNQCPQPRAHTRVQSQQTCRPPSTQCRMASEKGRDLPEHRSARRQRRAGPPRATCRAQKARLQQPRGARKQQIQKTQEKQQHRTHMSRYPPRKEWQNTRRGEAVQGSEIQPAAGALWPWRKGCW